MKKIKYYITLSLGLFYGFEGYSQACPSSTATMSNGSFETTTCTAPANPCTSPNITSDINYGCVSGWSASHGVPSLITGGGYWSNTGQNSVLLHANGNVGQGIFFPYLFGNGTSKTIEVYLQLTGNWYYDIPNQNGKVHIYAAKGLSNNTCNARIQNTPYVANSNKVFIKTVDLSTLSANSFTQISQRTAAGPTITQDYCYLWIYLEGDPNESVGVLVDDVNASTGGCNFNYPIVAPTTASSCSNIDFSFSATSYFAYNTGASNLIWDFGDGNISTDFNPIHQYKFPGTYTVTVKGNDFIGCAFSSTKTITITNALTDGTLSITGVINRKTCDEVPFGYNYVASTHSSTPETVSSISWSFENATIPLVVNNPTAGHIENYVYNAPGSYRVTLNVVLSSGCSLNLVQYVTITDPNISILANPSYYECETINFDFTTDGGSPTAVLWKFNDANNSQSTSFTPDFAYPTAGTYSVELVLDYGNGCTQSTTKLITVLDRALTIQSNSIAKECEGVDFNATYNGTSPTSFLWNFGDLANSTSSSINPTFAYNAAGIYTVSLVANYDSCQVTTTKQITITDRGIVMNMPSVACVSSPVSFSYSPQDADVVSQTWNFDGVTTSSQASASHTFTSSNTYNVTLTIDYSSGCTIVKTQSIIIDDPTATITATSNLACEGAFIGFQYTTSSLSGNSPINQTWDFGDESATSNAASPSHQYPVGGIYVVTLTLNFASGCTVVETISITIDKATVGISAPLEVCKGDPIPFSYFSGSISGNSPIGFSWDFGDNTPLNTNEYPSHTFTNTSTSSNPFTVSLTITLPGGCTATNTKDIIVSEYVNKEIFIGGLQNICLGEEVFYTLSGDVLDASSFLWDFGNGQTSTLQNPTTHYLSSGSYAVSVTANYNQTCVNPATDERTVLVGEFDFCTSCDDCIGSFSPEAGAKYVLSAWVKESDYLDKATYNDAGVQFYYEGANIYSSIYKAKGPIIEGWQQIEEVFEIPAGASTINIELKNGGSGDVYFDDVRIFPFDANIKSFVYDPITMRLTAELDENNYATFYEYDEDGNLIRVKKETDRGIKTIQETIKRLKQKQ